MLPRIMKLARVFSMSVSVFFIIPSVHAQTPSLIPTYTSIRDLIFIPKCLTCHAEGQRAEDVPLGDYTKMMADGSIVKAGDLAGSSLFSAIQGVGTNSPSMPPKRSAIPVVTPAELSVIKTWILNGAIEEEPAPVATPTPGPQG